jgi:anti-sigma regulatory factor (Ser/Thr protein kinase)/anti-anti-sigma regulatory factor
MSLDTTKYRLISVPADFDDDSLQGFFDELNLAIGDEPSEIALDCSLLEHATSRHINALWDALTRCERAGIPMRLTAVAYGLRRVLSVLDLTDLVTAEYEGDREDKPRRVPAQGRPSERFEVEIEARIDGVTDVMGELHTFLKRLDLTEIGVFDLEIVFYEVATNICRHSGLEQHRKIRFVADLSEDEIFFEFTDAGERFDPTGNTPEFDPRLAIRRRQSRGIGLVMIQRLMDSISYDRVDRRFNVVTLRKRLTPRVEVVE